jgi:hypothetical protein
MGIEQLFEETQQVYDIDELIQTVALNKGNVSGIVSSKDKVVKEAISPRGVDAREGDGWSMRDEIHPTPRSRLKAGLQPSIRRPSAAPVALRVATAFIARLFGKKVLASR